uniref:Reverse transcriptase Ty1/copia-type domain-containing protein n=1 Tax=Cannabis sativa TaxID=3483 RepID=A0A803PJ98_CANSA
MQLSISVKNKLNFHDGSIPKPPISHHVLYNAWIRNNNIIIPWILNSISKEISFTILYDESTANIWTDLKVSFHQRNGSHVYNLKQGLMNFKQNTQSLGMYFTKLKSIWEELSNYRPTCTYNGCTCGGVKKLKEFHHMEYIICFLKGLTDTYSEVRSSILLMDPLPEINRVLHLVTQDKNQKGKMAAANDPNANMEFSFQKDKNVQNRNDNQGDKTYPPKKGRPFVVTNKTWTYVRLPPNKTAIGCHLIYEIKYNSDGSIERCKAHLVAKGYTQQKALDFFDTFSTIPKMVAFKLQLAIVTIKQWHTLQIDVDKTFLNGDLNKEVYMELHKRLNLPNSIESNFNLVCKLNKSIYGLKQTSRKWYRKLSTAILQEGFTQSKADYTLFTRGHNDSFVAFKPAKTPMDPKIKLDDPTGVPLDNPSQYRQLVGNLLYLTLSRPEITYAVNTLGQFMTAPRTPHMQAVHHLLRYFKGNP